MSKLLFNKGFSGFGQLGIFLLMIGAGMVAGSVISVGVWLVATGQPLANIAQDMLNPKYANAIKTMQAVSTLFTFFLPTVGFAFICFKNGWQAIGFSKTWLWKMLGLSILILLASGPLIDALSSLNKAIPISKSARLFFDNLEKSYEDQVKAIAEVKTISQFFMSLIMVALLPALFEEVAFRGGLQSLLHRWLKSPWAALIITSVVFSAVHASWYGFLPRIALGILLGLVYHFTQNIWYSIAIHFLNNAMVVCYMYFLQASGKDMKLAGEPSFPWWVGIISVVVLVWLFKLLRKTAQTVVPQEVFYEPHNPFDERNTVA